MRPLRHPLFWLLPGLLWGAWLCYASLMPVPVGTPLPHDKLLHFGAYFTLLYLLGCCVDLPRLPLAILAGAALGVGLEYLQGLTPHRSFEWADGLANLAGAVAGSVFAATPAGRLFLWLERRYAGA